MKRLAFIFCSTAAILLFHESCKDQLPTQEDSSNIVLPDSNLSYSGDVERLFQSQCLGCHSGLYAPDLTPPSYSSLMNYQPQLVVAGDGQNSLLIQILDGRIGSPMPPTKPLTANQINGVKRWIDEGAFNN